MSASREVAAMLSTLKPGEEADFFALMTCKEKLTTRDGKPYFKVGFRDADRELTVPVWADSPWHDDCRDRWSPGACYKLRATLRETSFGPQLEIRKMRPATNDDVAAGFDPLMLRPRSRFDPESMFAELLTVVDAGISDAPLREFVLAALIDNRAELLGLPAAVRTHHAFVGGWLEHTLNVARLTSFMAGRYADLSDGEPPALRAELAVAGAALHDLGKLREIEWQAEGPALTVEGQLIGHVLLGRDMLREIRDRERAAGRQPPDDETFAHLEHIVISHHGTAELGSPKPPMTPEALLVRHADDVDAKFAMACEALRREAPDGPFTSKRNALNQLWYRGAVRSSSSSPCSRPTDSSS